MKKRKLSHYTLLFDDIETRGYYKNKIDASQAAEYERFMYGSIVECVAVYN